ncbi:MAG: hypothetical protein J6X58_03960 [Bacteroidales bacterium]|nr:hypothetical protein [Bacteroidales bacterium]
MKDNRHKEIVLKDIREALIDKNDFAEDPATSVGENTFLVTDDDLSIVFAQNFTKSGATLYYCYNESDIRDKILEIQKLHGNITIGCASANLESFLGHLGVENRCLCTLSETHPLSATLCEALIAWQGSIVITSNLGLGVTVPALSETTIVLAFTSQVVTDWEAANERLKQLYPEYPNQIMITHPASYAYRKGQQKIYLILIEDEN